MSRNCRVVRQAREDVRLRPENRINKGLGMPCSTIIGGAWRSASMIAEYSLDGYFDARSLGHLGNSVRGSRSDGRRPSFLFLGRIVHLGICCAGSYRCGQAEIRRRGSIGLSVLLCLWRYSPQDHFDLNKCALADVGGRAFSLARALSGSTTSSLGHDRPVQLHTPPTVHGLYPNHVRLLAAVAEPAHPADVSGAGRHV